MENETVVETFGPLEPIVDVSLDIETMARDPKAIVISIGACTQDAHFHCYLNFKEQLALNRLLEADTLAWHMENHSDLFTQQLVAILRVDEILFNIFKGLKRWFIHNNLMETNCQVWMNSPSFDSVILSNLAEQANFPLPWIYKQERDLRTLKALAEDKAPYKYAHLPNPPDNAHDALVDAKYQLEIISQCKRILQC